MPPANTPLDLHTAIFKTLSNDAGFRDVTAGAGIYDMMPAKKTSFPYVVMGTSSDEPIYLTGRDAVVVHLRFAIHSDRKDRRDLLAVLHAMRVALEDVPVANHVVARCELRQLAVLQDPSSTPDRPRVTMHVEARVALQPV